VPEPYLNKRAPRDPKAMMPPFVNQNRPLTDWNKAGMGLPDAHNEDFVLGFNLPVNVVQHMK